MKYIQRIKHTPGEVGIWLLVFIDLTVFGALFVNYSWVMKQSAAGSWTELAGFDRNLGGLSAILLLTSSWFVAMGMMAVRDQRVTAARKYILGAVGLGALFVVIKIYEYARIIQTGILPTTNEFFAFFFALTGLHLFHTMVGISVLLWMRSRMNKIISDRNIQHLESGATFWHMVDLLWIIIFSLLYLL